MHKLGWWSVALLVCSTTSFAHENWVLARLPKSATNALSKAQICCGHDFPKSDILVAERLLAEMEVVGPGGATIPYKPTAEDKTWTTDIAFDKAGVWMVSFALKKPQESEPICRGRSLMVVGGQDDPLRYARKKGLEIVPGAVLSTLKPGDTLPVSILQNGTPIEGKIAVTPEKGSASFLSTGKDRPAQLKIPSAGAYLLTVSSKGKTFALTFTVAESTQGGTR
ncbi:MAG: DUF4198 domain-containing protein [Verrucomicrobiota bacterium]|nr:DUF4198 domain-containing protein [Verrucomicrobiota bacterium]